MNRRIFGWMVAAGIAALSGAAAAAGTAAAPDVVMYATADCGYCAKARAYFDERGVAFEERDIDASPAARSEWKEKGGIGTPLILINGRRFQGFDPSALDAMLSTESA
ncbi:MAG: glutaredoxin family protein [Lysobacteraceae bacterium]|nr:MAG: glutaredoxin family protein [Xanthomonadaceae bacterium]